MSKDAECKEIKGEKKKSTSPWADLTLEFSCFCSEQGLGVSKGQFQVITSVILFYHNLMFLLNWMSLYSCT